MRNRDRSLGVARGQGSRIGQVGQNVPVPAPIDSSLGVLPDRQRLLMLAGIDEAELARLTKAAIDKAHDKLSATKRQRLTVAVAGGGATVAEYEDQAHDVQLRAAEMLVELLGLNAGRSAATPAPSVRFNVSFAPMPGEGLEGGPVIDVTPPRSSGSAPSQGSEAGR